VKNKDKTDWKTKSLSNLWDCNNNNNNNKYNICNCGPERDEKESRAEK
jgi:hypothetical protein